MAHYSDELFSDLYKDAHGVRPHHHEYWQATPARKQAIWDQLEVEFTDALEQEAAQIAQAVTKFEAQIALVSKSEGVGRLQAIANILRTLEDGYCDAGYYAYQLGVPYSYTTEFNAALAL
jgi:hypothetical protein